MCSSNNLMGLFIMMAGATYLHTSILHMRFKKRIFKYLVLVMGYLEYLEC